MTVFVHSSFRTSSTWLWHCFRKYPRTISYYEIFNESLHSITRQKCIELGGDGGVLGHDIDRPYFAEYADLVRPDGGVIDFKTPPEETWYFIPQADRDGPLSAGELKYLNTLIKNAHIKEKIPVLTSVRSLGRMRAIKKAYSKIHIFLFRNILAQWASYCSESNNDNKYFMRTVTVYSYANQHDKIMRLICHMCMRIGAHDNKDFCIDDGLLSFVAFCTFHFYLYMLAWPEADIVIDADRLALDVGYRGEMSGRILAETGVSVDLDTVILPRITIPSALAGEQAIVSALDAARTIVSEHAGSDLLGALPFIDQLIVDAIRLWRRFQ